jgi:hypothetical protein
MTKKNKEVKATIEIYGTPEMLRAFLDAYNEVSSFANDVDFGEEYGECNPLDFYWSEIENGINDVIEDEE